MFTIKQVINECAIYDIVDVNGLEYNLQTETEHEKDRKTLRIRKGMIKDETWSIEIVLFSSLVDEVSNNMSHDFKKMTPRKPWMIAFWNQLKLQRFQKMMKLLFL